MLAVLLVAYYTHVVPALLNGEEEEEAGEEVGEAEAGEVEEEEAGEDFAASAGSIAFTGGLVLNALFTIYNRARRLGLSIKAVPARYVLDLHIALNVALSILAFWHAFVFASRAGPVEYGAVGLIVLLLASGLVMRYVGYRRARLLSRMVHAQLVLSLVLVALLLIHVGSVGE
jgi:predicted membrane protein